MSDIKRIKPNKNSGFKQSYFKPRNLQKYVGSFPIICRSSWEKKFAIFCDTNDRVVKWSSEPVEIPYYNPLDKKNHRYFPDFYVQVDRGNGTLTSYLVEIKPKSQLVKPNPPKTITQKSVESYKRLFYTYVMNLCKRDALEKYAENRGMKALFITEHSAIL